MAWRVASGEWRVACVYKSRAYCVSWRCKRQYRWDTQCSECPPVRAPLSSRRAL